MDIWYTQAAARTLVSPVPCALIHVTHMNSLILHLTIVPYGCISTTTFTSVVRTDHRSTHVFVSGYSGCGVVAPRFCQVGSRCGCRPHKLASPFLRAVDTYGYMGFWRGLPGPFFFVCFSRPTIPPRYWLSPPIPCRAHPLVAVA